MLASVLTYSETVHCFLLIQIKQKKLDKEMALAENRSLADFNLSREPRLREGRAQLARLHQEARSVRDVYDKDRRQLGKYQRS